MEPVLTRGFSAYFVCCSCEANTWENFRNSCRKQNGNQNGNVEIVNSNLLDSLQRPVMLSRSGHQRCSVRNDVLKNFAKLTGKYLCQGLFFNKVAGRPAILLKERPWHRCFPVTFAKFFLQSTSGRLLLVIIKIIFYLMTSLLKPMRNMTYFLVAFIVYL